MHSFSSLSRRHFVATIALTSTVASAQKFPDRPIRIIIPYAAGGGTDNLIRAIAQQVSSTLGQPLIIDNRPGGSTIIGTEAVSRAVPDGYTLLATDTAVVVNPGLFKSKISFDTAKTLQGVTMMAYAPVVLAIHPSVPSRNLPELLALARAKPGSLNYASGGSGSSSHLAGELLKTSAKVLITHIPYKGTSLALNDLLAGQVQMQFGGISSLRQHILSGKLRAIAVTGKERSPALPDVATFAEFELNVDADSYWGVYAPAGVPKEIVDTLQLHLQNALRDPANAEKLAGLGFVPIGNTPMEHTRQMRRLIDTWTKVIDDARIQIE